LLHKLRKGYFMGSFELPAVMFGLIGIISAFTVLFSLIGIIITVYGTDSDY